MLSLCHTLEPVGMGCALSKHASSNDLPAWDIIDSGTIIQQFQNLNNEILRFSENLFRPLPPYSQKLADSPLFRFLASLNKRLESDILLPFHPCLSSAESQKYNLTYETRFKSGESNFRAVTSPISIVFIAIVSIRIPPCGSSRQRERIFQN